MLSIQLDADDVKTLVENIPGAAVGVEYKDKQFHIAHSSGASVVIKLEKDPDRAGRLLLYAPWSKMKWVGLPSGWGARQGWNLLEAKVIERLRDELDARGIPREIVSLVKKDPYIEVGADGKKVKKSGYLGFSIDYMLLRSHVLTFMIQGNMISLGKIDLKPESITIGFTVEAAPAVLTREDDGDDDGDYDDDDEYVDDDDYTDDDDEIAEEDD